MIDGRLTALLHLCDSLFPTGAYAHSDGLESATASGAVADGAGVRAWLDTVLDGTLAHLDGPAVLFACEACIERHWDQLRRLDDDVHAQRPSSTGREASRSIGTRLLRTWFRLHRPQPDFDALVPAGAAAPWTLPVAFAVACASVGIDTRSTLEAFMYTRLSAVAAAAMRLMPLGQIEAHSLVADALVRVPEVCLGVMQRRERPSVFTPLADLAAMRQQYVTSRLFRS